MPGLREDTRGASSCAASQPLDGWFSSVGRNSDVRQDGEGWRRQSAGRMPLPCPGKHSGSSANPPSSRRAGAGTAERTIPRDGARLLMFRPGRCQPAHFL